MNFSKREDQIISELSDLYKRHGYKKYKPSCFEEYSLYQENKNFLIGKNVITFSDLGGRLMALRPDVSLSLIKHTDAEEGMTEKYYYNEKVYRQAAGGRDFKEISQTGVEIIGNIDEACVTELSVLICETLAAVDGQYILDISHMGFTEGLISEFPDKRGLLFEFLKSKNIHDFYALAERENFPASLVNAFEVIASVSGNPQYALNKAKEVCLNSAMSNAVAELERLVSRLNKLGYLQNININFSIANNADYYNGVIFNGYINGVPHRVLSGGRYDNLLNKLGKAGGAIGFALYLGEIERFLKHDEASVNCLIIYDLSCQDEALLKSRELIENGYSVRLSRTVPDDIKFGEIINLVNGGRKC